MGSRSRSAGPRLATGHAALDAALEGGWPVGTLIELLADGAGSGRITLLLPALAALTRAGHDLAWLPADEAPYAPALSQAGVDLSHVLVMDVQEPKRRLWAAERCLQSGSCAALVMQETQRIADPWLRRLKLAAAAGSASVFLLRPASAAATPSPASLRMHVGAHPHTRTRLISLLKGAGPSARMLDLDPYAAGH
ncbi:MAG TPA: translesion DNA synthesis-associated protein ImuA [Gammaproteobacteria bacterium]